MASPSWTNNELKRLGVYLRDGAKRGSFPSYDRVRLHYGLLAVEVQEQIKAQEWNHLLGRQRLEVTSRAKTLDTLREKLRRDRSTPLSNVQDIAGVRFEAEMSLSEQRAVAETIARMFDHDPDHAVHDLLSAPHSGYRALHVWLRLPERVEVQVRTQLQGAWANLYEEAGDLFGREIRYGEPPARAIDQLKVEHLKMLSLGEIASMEQDHDALYRTADEFQHQLRRYQNDNPAGWAVRMSDPSIQALLLEFERRKTELYQVERDLHERIQRLARELTYNESWEGMV